jgi:hypothetical protein
MQAINSPSFGRFRRPRQQGVAVVEFAVVAIIFFMVFFGVVEMARVMYICNTLQEVTRRAAEGATHVDFTDSVALQRIREAAIFRSSPGSLMFAEPITDAHVKIDFLAITRDGTSLALTPVHALPDSPEHNQQICMLDANDARCIRMVRVRICRPGDGDTCEAVPYQPLVSLIPLLISHLPVSTTTSVAETLGRPAGLPPAPG